MRLFLEPRYATVLTMIVMAKRMKIHATMETNVPSIHARVRTVANTHL